MISAPISLAPHLHRAVIDRPVGRATAGESVQELVDFIEAGGADAHLATYERDARQVVRDAAVCRRAALCR